MKYPYKTWKYKSLVARQCYSWINRITVWKENKYVTEYTIETLPKHFKEG